MVLSRFGAFASLFNLEKLGEGGRVLFGKRQMGLQGARSSHFRWQIERAGKRHRKLVDTKTLFHTHGQKQRSDKARDPQAGAPRPL